MSLAQLFEALAAHHFAVLSINGGSPGATVIASAIRACRLMEFGPVFVDVLIPEGDESPGLTERLWIRDGQILAPHGSTLHGVLVGF